MLTSGERRVALEASWYSTATTRGYCSGPAFSSTATLKRAVAIPPGGKSPTYTLPSRGSMGLPSSWKVRAIVLFPQRVPVFRRVRVIYPSPPAFRSGAVISSTAIITSSFTLKGRSICSVLVAYWKVTLPSPIRASETREV